ncbi:hypothetical protein OESDEN_13889, partial [Oesophagostomum dentatum]
LFQQFTEFQYCIQNADWRTKLEAVRNARLQERAEQRKKERREKWARAKVEEERRRREEEERQRQQLIEEQRRAAREPRGPARREMDTDSKAMADSDWRGGMRERQAMPSRPMPSRDRDMGDRPPMRERDNIISQADRDDSWRRGMSTGPAPPPPSFRERAAPAPASIADKDTSWRSNLAPAPPPPAAAPSDGPPRRIGPPTSGAPTEGTWARGNVVKKEPPAFGANPAAKPSEGGKFIPSRLRNQGAQQGGLPPRDMGPNRDTRRIGARGGAAENDTNWRRK